MGFFDANNSEHQGLANAFNNGTYDQLPQDQVMTHLQSFFQNTPPEESQQMQQEYFNQMPQVQKQGLFSGLMNIMGQNGVDPRQAGVHTTDPNRASGMDVGNLFQFAMNSGLLGGLMGGGQRQQSGLGGMLGGLLGGGQQQAPQYQQGHGQQSGGQAGGLQGLLGNPMAQAALSGLIAFAANRALNGMANRGNQQQMPSSNQYQDNPNQGNQGSVWQQQQPNLNRQSFGGSSNSGGGSALPGFENDNREA